MSKILNYIKEDLLAIKDWYLALFSALLGIFNPFFGVALAFSSLFSKRQLWVNDLENYRNLRNFTIISLICNGIILIATILEMIKDQPDVSNEIVKLLFSF